MKFIFRKRSLVLNIYTNLKKGTLSSGGSTSDVLMQVDLPILTDEACTNSIYSPNIDSTTQVCAGDGTGKDTCQGDSGEIFCFISIFIPLLEIRYKIYFIIIKVAHL